VRDARWSFSSRDSAPYHSQDRRSGICQAGGTFQLFIELCLHLPPLSPWSPPPSTPRAARIPSRSSSTTISPASPNPTIPSTPRTTAGSAWNGSPAWRRDSKPAGTTQKASHVSNAAILNVASSIFVPFHVKDSIPRAGNCTAFARPAPRNAPCCSPNISTNSSSSSFLTDSSFSLSPRAAAALARREPEGPSDLFPT